MKGHLQIFLITLVWLISSSFQKLLSINIHCNNHCHFFFVNGVSKYDGYEFQTPSKLNQDATFTHELYVGDEIMIELDTNNSDDTYPYFLRLASDYTSAGYNFKIRSNIVGKVEKMAMIMLILLYQAR